MLGGYRRAFDTLLQSTVWPEILDNKGTVKSIIAKYKNQLNSQINEIYTGKVVS